MSDIDSQRMTLRVEQGKGQQDRYVMRRLAARASWHVRPLWRSVERRFIAFVGVAFWVWPVMSSRAPVERQGNHSFRCIDPYFGEPIARHWDRDEKSV
ncbi:hypothetical protein [Roseiarcus sp.]|uniref:hypothetical protein n=1 Tax=Roseiarcus sp. TaxID=1969460 RepID=UPI003F998C79